MDALILHYAGSPSQIAAQYTASASLSWPGSSKLEILQGDPWDPLQVLTLIIGSERLEPACYPGPPGPGPGPLQVHVIQDLQDRVGEVGILWETQSDQNGVLQGHGCCIFLRR